MKRMLINATHSEEIRVALADGQKLYNLDIDVPGENRKKGNIYKGKITRVEPSLEAAFVEYGSNRHGFLPYKEISRNYYTAAANKAKERPPINIAIKQGTEVIIQVVKEERGNKGAAITTYISLAGRYLVYMPENPKAGGISRRIEGKARQELQDTLNKIKPPKNSGIIVRTAGIGRSAEELDWDLNYLDQVWTAIKTVSANRKAPFFIYQESDIFIRALRDYLRPDVGEILIDNKEVYQKARDFMQQVMPHNLKKLAYYNDTIPLFSRYQIESQIQSAFAREVSLPSGGSIVIDHTEALISIDINSARATKGADIEETALNTNLEAADEIARQLRIRDLGGLVVIDFIDMRNLNNQRSVEQQLNEAVSNDRARTQLAKISKFGLLEMSRQRLKSSINEASQFPCPRCSGHGFIRNIESLSVSILRILEEEALKPGTGKVIAQVPTKVANFITNDKRLELHNLETRHSVPILIVANEHFQSPQFDITRLKKSEAKNFDNNNIVLKKPENEEKAENKSSQAAHQQRPKAAVDSLVPDSQAPKRVVKTQDDKGGLFSWIKNIFSANSTTTDKLPKQQEQPQYKNKRKPQKQNKQNKQPNKQHTNNKPKHNQVKNKAPGQHKPKKTSNTNNRNNTQANKHKQQQNKKPRQPVDKKINDSNSKPVEQKNQNSDSDVVDQKLIQRPLGSVASYAANKVKQTTDNKATVENVVPEKKAPEKKTPERKVPEKKIPERKAPEKKTPEKEIPERKAPERKAPEKKAPEKKIPEKEIPERKAPEKKAPEKKTPERKVPEKPKPVATPKKPIQNNTNHIDFDI
ncbi:MAG: Rne/Rng family ribonuclease [Proteobacteria bacterium]|nr:Rne/Rng family ribonuclease [Pseudomonadota bacterium]